METNNIEHIMYHISSQTLSLRTHSHSKKLLRTPKNFKLLYLPIYIVHQLKQI